MARAEKPLSSKKFLAARCPGRAKAPTPTQAARTASSAVPATTEAPTTPLAEQAVDGEEDGPPAATPLLVGPDRSQLVGREARQPGHDLRRRQPVVLPDGQIGRRRRAGSAGGGAARTGGGAGGPGGLGRRCLGRLGGFGGLGRRAGLRRRACSGRLRGGRPGGGRRRRGGGGGSQRWVGWAGARSGWP